MMLLLLSLVTAFAGFLCIAASMGRHRDQMAGRRTGSQPSLAARLAGSALLAVSLALSIAAGGLGIGLTLWTGLLTIAGVGLALILTYWPRTLSPVLALLPQRKGSSS